MVINLLQTIIFLMPVIGILAGLSLSVSIGAFFALLTIKFYKNLKFKTTALLSLFLLWSFISCFWSANVLGSMLLLSYVALLILLSFSMIHSLGSKEQSELSNIIFTPLLIGVLVAILLFFIEYVSGGFFSLRFKYLVQGKEGPFALYWLDRGCSFLSVISWVAIGRLFEKRKYIYGFLLAAIMFLLLIKSDSLASFVGFSLGLIGFVTLYISKMRLGFLVRIAFATYILTMPIASFYQNPHELSDKYSIPESAKHRLFIWNFVANKALEKPFIGYGFGSSRYVAEQDDFVEYHKGLNWHLLPVHPHNNSLQMLLEMGIIGLFLFVFIVDAILKHIIIRSRSPIGGAISISCFVNYFFVAMVSFGAWQTWWISVGVFATVIVSIFFLNSKTK